MLDLSRIGEAVRYEGGLSRRLFLAYGAALSSLPLAAERAVAADRKLTFEADPFSLGVASGDPADTSVVLWTKLAPRPLEVDGGLKPETIAVTWEIAEDEAMKKVIGSGTVIATPQLGHTVHVEARGLQPDRWYWYRFRAGDAVSVIGRTRTLPAADAVPSRLKLAIASCPNYEQGHFTAYEQMAKDELDLVLHLGDYIYEYPHRPDAMRQHSGPKDAKLRSLSDYRGRHMQYRADPLLHRMHAICPWFVTWDDHEVENNYANDIHENRGKAPASTPAEFLVQRAAAYQAYYEMMPLRRQSLPHGPSMQLYRKASYGRLAELFVLDTRQYRTDQPNNDGVKPLNDDALKPTNTLLGTKQRNWLNASLLASSANWNVLAQQVMMALVNNPSGVAEGYSMDKWAGAAHERIELMRFLADRKVLNPIVLTGDIHTNWANDLRVDDRNPDTPIVATEYVGTSITSGGNGSKDFAGLSKLKAENPLVKFHNRERGYVRCTVTPTLWQSDYVVVEDVLKPGGKTLTRASFVTESGVPGAKPA